MFSTRNTSRLAALALAALVVLSGGKCQARQLDPLGEQLAALAKEVQKVVQQQKQEAVMIGDFTGPANLGTGAGPAIQRLLIEELKRLGLRVEKEASLEVKGDYGKVKNPKTGLQEFKLTIGVLDGNRDPVALFPGRFVSDDETLVRLMGGSGKVKPGASPADRNRKASDSIDRPNVFVDGFQVRSGKDSPYALEVFVRPHKGAPAVARSIRGEKGQAFIDLNPGEEYVIRLTNNSNKEVGATLNIDGLDAFTFATEKNPLTGEPFRYYIMAPNSQRVIRGWTETMKEVRAFEVADYGFGEASKLLGSSAKVGTITATFRTTYEVRPLGAVGSTFDSSGPVETKRGDKIADNQNAVMREYNEMHDWVTVRYNRSAR